LRFTRWTYPRGTRGNNERRLRLRDGRAVWVRPIVPSDAPQLAAAIRATDADTLHRRFLGAPPRVTPALMTRLTALDYRRRFALAAADGETGRGVAVARYEPLADGVADVAVVVDPRWRRAGLATALIELLAEAAVDRGVHTFSSSYLAENRPVAALLARAGGAGKQTINDGIAEFVVALDRERVGAGKQSLDETPGSGPRPTGTADH
jgi:RimJ/RimL family protein N-acetyltransferase